MQIRTSRQDLFALLAILIFTSQACHAHVETAAAGFVSGLLHPVFGIDHLLAMLSVGIVSAQLGGRHILLVPSTFVVSMVTGASLGVLGYDIPFLEAGIALSVILLGTAIILIRGGQRSYVVYLFVAFFGSLHGYAHGLE